MHKKKKQLGFNKSWPFFQVKINSLYNLQRIINIVVLKTNMSRSLHNPAGHFKKKDVSHSDVIHSQFSLDQMHKNLSQEFEAKMEDYKQMVKAEFLEKLRIKENEHNQFIAEIDSVVCKQENEMASLKKVLAEKEFHIKTLSQEKSLLQDSLSKQKEMSLSSIKSMVNEKSMLLNEISSRNFNLQQKLKELEESNLNYSTKLADQTKLVEQLTKELENAKLMQQLKKNYSQATTRFSNITGTIADTENKENFFSGSPSHTSAPNSDRLLKKISSQEHEIQNLGEQLKQSLVATSRFKQAHQLLEEELKNMTHRLKDYEVQIIETKSVYDRTNSCSLIESNHIEHNQAGTAFQKPKDVADLKESIALIIKGLTDNLNYSHNNNEAQWQSTNSQSYSNTNLPSHDSASHLNPHSQEINLMRIQENASFCNDSSVEVQKIIKRLQSERNLEYSKLNQDIVDLTSKITSRDIMEQSVLNAMKDSKITQMEKEFQELQENFISIQKQHCKLKEAYNAEQNKSLHLENKILEVNKKLNQQLNIIQEKESELKELKKLTINCSCQNELAELKMKYIALQDELKKEQQKCITETESKNYYYKELSLMNKELLRLQNNLKKPADGQEKMSIKVRLDFHKTDKLVTGIIFKSQHLLKKMFTIAKTEKNSDKKFDFTHVRNSFIKDSYTNTSTELITPRTALQIKPLEVEQAIEEILKDALKNPADAIYMPSMLGSFIKVILTSESNLRQTEEEKQLLLKQIQNMRGLIQGNAVINKEYKKQAEKFLKSENAARVIQRCFRKKKMNKLRTKTACHEQNKIFEMNIEKLQHEKMRALSNMAKHFLLQSFAKNNEIMSSLSKAILPGKMLKIKHNNQI